MVEIIRGRGQHFRDFSEQLGVEVAKYNIIFFRQADDFSEGDIREPEVLKRLESLPELDRNSLLLTDVTATDGKPLHLLLVPRGAPDLDPTREQSCVGGQLPPEGETFLVMVRKRRDPTRTFRLLVLVDNPTAAEKIAKRKASDTLGCLRLDLETEVSLLSQEEFYQEAKQQIDQGLRLPNRILCFGDLRRYALARQAGSDQ